MAVIEYVEQFLYEDTYMCTYDHKDSLPGFCDFKDAGENYTCGYNLNCANFVITCLRNTGELTDEMYQAIPSGLRCAVEGVRVLCEERNTGYRVIQAKDAQPGDIWYWKDANHSHTEFVASVKDGKLTTVGSNNIRTAIQQPPCKKVCEYSSDPGKYQAVIYTDRNLTDGKVCSKR
jgi:hypothetical protein